MSKRLAAALVGGLIIVAVVGTGAVYLVNQTEAAALPGAETALQSGDGVTVETEPWYSFIPDERSSTAFIFYPGARVDPTAYAPAARGIAEGGFLTVVVPMPFGIAALGAEKADEVMEAYPEIERWVVGGHSIGGAMAVQYTDDHTDIVDGIALWGAYPSPDDDISETRIPTVSVFASEDGLSSVGEIEDTAQYLPQGTEFVEIAGGNHTNFGLYETQDGDGVATITPAEQQFQAMAATLDLMEAVDAK
ncbi:MAG: alpha/beta hydrolase [Acidimicrobiales bacterium]